MNIGPKQHGRQTTGTPYLVDQYLKQMNNHIYQAPQTVAVNPKGAEKKHQ